MTVTSGWDYLVAKCNEAGIWDKDRKALLKYYNKLDVQPFMVAFLKHKEMFYKMNIDMHMDGVTMSGLPQIAFNRKMQIPRVTVPECPPPHCYLSRDKQENQTL